MLIGFAASVAAFGQVMIDPAKFRDLQSRLSRTDSTRLRCEVTPFKPRLDFGFRFQSGYVIRVPMEQYEGEGHRWAVVTRVTPEGAAAPSYLMSALRLPVVPKTKAELETGGSFLVGEGKYAVELTLYDDSGRSCVKRWKVDAKRSRAERGMTMRIPDKTVRSLASPRSSPPGRAGERPYRITVLMHAAPMMPRSTRLRGYDRQLLLGSLAPLIEQLPVQSVRLVVFNLDQQKKLIEKDTFRQRDMNEVAELMNTLELGKVDYKVLNNPGGHLRFLSELIDKELATAERSDAVILFGPMSRYFEKFDSPAAEERSLGGPKFFSVQFRSQFNRGAEFPDLLENTVKALKGKSFVVHTPGEFSKAIQEIESRLPRSLGRRVDLQ